MTLNGPKEKNNDDDDDDGERFLKRTLFISGVFEIEFKLETVLKQNLGMTR